MYNGKTISLGQIIWKVFTNKLVVDLTYDDAASYALEFIRLVGAPLAFNNKTDKIKVNEHKAALPDNLIQVRGIKLIPGNLKNFESINTIPNQETALRYATDIYHQHKGCSDGDDCNNVEYTYEIQNGIIFTAFSKGTVVISYKAIGLDKDGYPLIPDNEKFKLGLEYYITHRYLEGLWAMGKVTDKVFQYYEQKRHWYLGAANSSLQMPTIDQLESVMNGLTRIIHNDYSHSQFFERFGQKERIKRYN